MKDNPLQFALVPLGPDEIDSGSAEEPAEEEKGKPAAAKKDPRTFKFEAPNAEQKARWVKALRGRRADGLHRADSGDFAQLYAMVASSRASVPASSSSAGAATAAAAAAAAASGGGGTTA